MLGGSVGGMGWFFGGKLGFFTGLQGFNLFSRLWLCWTVSRNLELKLMFSLSQGLVSLGFWVVGDALIFPGPLGWFNGAFCWLVNTLEIP